MGNLTPIEHLHVLEDRIAAAASILGTPMPCVMSAHVALTWRTFGLADDVHTLTVVSLQGGSRIRVKVTKGDWDQKTIDAIKQWVLEHWPRQRVYNGKFVLKFELPTAGFATRSAR